MQEYFWKNKAGLSLFSACWECPSPRAVVAMVHGQGEHIGRYAHLAQKFNAAGMAFWGHDQQGFGKSEGKRGHAPNLDAYLDDICLLIDHITEKFPGVPVFLYGHSMGGNVTLNYLLRRNDHRISAMIATDPWIRLAFTAPAWKLALGKMLRSIVPALSLPSELDTKLLSRDPEVVRVYNNDPLVHDRVSAAGGMALVDGAAWLNAYAGPTPCRTLLMHGSADGITSMAGTRDFAGRLQGDVTLKIWEGLFHEIHNEPEQEEVFRFTLDWLDKA